MPNYGVKFSSRYISTDEMREFADQLPGVLQALLGDCVLTVYYGHRCNIHGDLQYKPMRVGLDVFELFMEDSISQQIFKYCESDLSIVAPEKAIHITLCHEADIHIDGSDDSMIKKLTDRFPQLDFRTADEWRQVYDHPRD